MAKVLSVDLSKCTGCRACELACSMTNTGEFNPSRSGIHVSFFHREFVYIPVVCLQCGDAPCAEVCPTRAIVRNESTGAMEISKTKCIGCKMCTMACPFGNIEFDAVEQRAAKCELCHGDPRCVLYCVTKALEFRESQAVGAEKRRALSEKLREVYYSLKGDT